ncbi:MAG TPA: tryptophan-rich sensory protein [Beijerinckiaceae bacterium]|mgnify:CR=1 FL=1|nr:tryptophan-rich sensory protein [Beijerinckiaceae bacterium]
MTEPSLRLPDDPEPGFPPPKQPGSREPAGSFASLIKLGLSLVIVVAVSWLGQLGTMRGLVDWYPGLAKPSFTPPNIVFPIVWTGLYGLMAFSLWRLLRWPAATPGRDKALAVLAVQLGLNVLWSWAFFAARNPLAGLFVILALELTILWMIVVIAAVDRTAAQAQIPYAAWVGFASLLNAAIWWLN